MTDKNIWVRLLSVMSFLTILLFFGCGGLGQDPKTNGGGGGGGGGGDTTTPVTSINSAPTNPTNSTSAQFEFSCNKSPCTFECSLDSQGWASCSSPTAYSGLAAGGHTFEARAKDSSGRVDPSPPSYNWIILAISPDMDGIGYLVTSSIIENRTQVFWGVPISVINDNLAVTITMIGQSWADSESGDVKDPGTGYDTTLTGYISGANLNISNGIIKIPGKPTVHFTCSGGGQYSSGVMNLGVSGFINNIWDLGMGGWQVIVDPVSGTIQIVPLPGGGAGNLMQILFPLDSKATTAITQGTWTYERKMVFTSGGSEWDTGTASFTGSSPNISFSSTYNWQLNDGTSGAGSGALSGWSLSADGHKLTKTGNDGQCLGVNNCAYDGFGFVSENTIAIHEKMTPPTGTTKAYSTVILTR